jgi:hypothetical protein
MFITTKMLLVSYVRQLVADVISTKLLVMLYVMWLVTDISTWRSLFDLRAIHVEFVVERVTLVQVYLCILWLSVVII